MLAALVAVVLHSTGVHGSMTYEELPVALPCDCSDVYPRDSFLDAKVEYSCWEQSTFEGACNQAFMRQTPEEVPEGYCQISCGRCRCCPSLADVMRGRGLNMFLWAITFTWEVDRYLAMPGYMATVLAPTDGAWWAALNKMGYSSKEQVEACAACKEQLANIARFHILPPERNSNAVWTRPFMRRNVAMPTLLGEGHPIIAQQDESTGRVTLDSPRSRAGVTEADVYACKGYVQVLDTVLIPWDMKGYGK